MVCDAKDSDSEWSDESEGLNHFAAPVVDLKQLPNGEEICSKSLWAKGPAVLMIIRRPG